MTLEQMKPVEDTIPHATETLPIDQESPQFPCVASRSHSGSPRGSVMHLLKRISQLKEAAQQYPKPDIQLVRPESDELLQLQSEDDDALWQEILVKFGNSEAPTNIAARHFDSIILVGMDANSVPFPHKLTRQSNGKGYTFIRSTMNCSSDLKEGSVANQDTVAFPFLSEIKNSWSNDAEKEVIEILVAGRAQEPCELRHAFYTEPSLDMELLPWPTLQDGVVAQDICTEEQERVSKLREKRPLSLEQVEKRRALLSKKLKKELNVGVFEECIPTLEREAALLQSQATRAQEKAMERAKYDELAEAGAHMVVWPVPHEKRWPEQSSAWKHHCKWFAMWRSQPTVICEFAFKPMKRSNSLSSIGSWEAVSEVSWVDVEAKASEFGWQEVVEEQLPLLTALRPTDIYKPDIVEIRSMGKPPAGVVLTMEVMCVLLQVPPIKLKDGGVDYWAASKKLMCQDDFLAQLNALNDYLPASVLDAVAPYMSVENFTPEVVGRSSIACRALCSWARELYKYHMLGQASADAAWQDIKNKPTAELLTESQDAIEQLPKAALQELKALAKPPREVVAVCSCLLHLFAGVVEEVELTKTGKVKDASWGACQKFLNNPDATLRHLQNFKQTIDAGMVAAMNVRRVRTILGNFNNPATMKAKSVSAGYLCKWLISTIAYWDRAAPPQQDCEVAQKSPPMEEVAGASQLVSKADIVEIKSLSKPPQPVMTVCVAVCILLGLDADAGWAGVKAMVSDVCFLQKLLACKKEDVSKEKAEKVREILNGEQAFNGENMKCVSKAAYGLFLWVLAMVE